jgi:hypothetical protein
MHFVYVHKNTTMIPVEIVLRSEGEGENEVEP